VSQTGISGGEKTARGDGPKVSRKKTGVPLAIKSGTTGGEGKGGILACRSEKKGRIHSIVGKGSLVSFCLKGGKKTWEGPKQEKKRPHLEKNKGQSWYKKARGRKWGTLLH